MPGIERPGSLDECLELISYYQELYEHGLEFLEESRPRSVAKLKGTGACPVFYSFCKRLCVGSTFIN